ncbi:uncharacterized protein LOC110698923 [Chenopodium quinoa]|uniref:uncharacterized protein LOC110698923 n=1 Tax=Chenopodium quinoa TaxID=63459 RepID=UPI000B76D2B3|nr:uncharacterized protein LOC110698923 [Chenopodium quinoa]
MFTPQKKVFTGWSLSPRRENQKTPVPNSNSSARIFENGGAIVVRDGDDLFGWKKLENEMLDYNVPGDGYGSWQKAEIFGSFVKWRSSLFTLPPFQPSKILRFTFNSLFCCDGYIYMSRAQK